MVEYRTAEGADASALINAMRAEDKAECEASGLTPQAAVLKSIGTSVESHALYVKGELLGIYGVVEHPESTTMVPLYYAWWLSTPAVEKYPVTFMRESLRTIWRLGQQYGTLINYVDARYTKALNWLERCGFEINTQANLRGPKGHRFYEVIRRPVMEV